MIETIAGNMAFVVPDTKHRQGPQRIRHVVAPVSYILPLSVPMFHQGILYLGIRLRV